ncbi:MAG: hypothetical protein NT062_36200 [Proteobacteria bacterium]|nr:hypothetical protein [Pseudomonadota bacterium]
MLVRAHQVVQQLAQLESIDVQNKAERLAADPAFLAAIHTTNDSERGMQAQKGFLQFLSNDKEQQSGKRPETLALVDDKGQIVAVFESPNIVKKAWLVPPKEDTSILPGVNYILGLPMVSGEAEGKRHRMVISDLWKNGENLMKVGIAPIVDPDATPTARDADNVAIVGAIVVAYAQTSTEAQRDRGLLGTEIAYFDGNKVAASSFTKGNAKDEDTQRAQALNASLASLKDKQTITVGDKTYIAAAVTMPRKATQKLPDNYPKVSAGAVVMAPVLPASSAAAVKMSILMVGIGALVFAVLGIYLSHRRLIAQVDQIEQGVNDIINGNVDRTFRPVGEELDGLANGLNVMLARLLGRPEPGDEEFDEEGNPIVPGRVEFEEGDEQSRTDPDLAMLAQESEPDYYKRVYTEYLTARKAAGNPDEVSFESFIAKLKVNEGKLKAQYQCRAVRFRVVSKDNKVSLKPVPIFA